MKTRLYTKVGKGSRVHDCPQHDLNAHQINQTFYKWLNIPTRQLVDSQLPIPMKNATDGYAAIEAMAKHALLWHENSKQYTKKATNETTDGIAVITTKLDSLGRDMNKLTQHVHAIEVGCDRYKGPHLNRNCPKEDQMTEEAKYGAFGIAIATMEITTEGIINKIAITDRAHQVTIRRKNRKCHTQKRRST